MSARATAAGVSAMQACAAKGEELISDFCIEDARAEVVRLLASGDMTGEALVDRCKAAGHRPHDDRAFGMVFAGLSAAGEIYRISSEPRRKGHGTNGAVLWSLRPRKKTSAAPDRGAARPVRGLRHGHANSAKL